MRIKDWLLTRLGRHVIPDDARWVKGPDRFLSTFSEPPPTCQPRTPQVEEYSSDDDDGGAMGLADNPNADAMSHKSSRSSRSKKSAKSGRSSKNKKKAAHVSGSGALRPGSAWGGV